MRLNPRRMVYAKGDAPILDQSMSARMSQSLSLSLSLRTEPLGAHLRDAPELRS